MSFLCTRGGYSPPPPFPTPMAAESGASFSRVVIAGNSGHTQTVTSYTHMLENEHDTNTRFTLTSSSFTTC